MRQKLSTYNDENSHVIKPFLSAAVPPRASARTSKMGKMRSRLPLPAAYDLADIDTVPPSPRSDLSSLDTIEHASSIYTQYMAGTKKTSKRLVKHEDLRHSFLFDPVESVRWWLLYPGRIEFLLWSGGTIILLMVTLLLVLATVLSLHIFI